MHAQQHRELQQARQRIARNRLALQGDALRLSGAVQEKLNVKLQSQRHPVLMLLGAAGVGMIASRLLSNLSGGHGWEQTLLRWAKSKLGSRFWRELLATVTKDREEVPDDDDEASAAEATS